MHLTFSPFLDPAGNGYTAHIQALGSLLSRGEPTRKRLLDRSGPPGLRSLDAAYALPSVAALVSNAGSRGYGQPLW